MPAFDTICCDLSCNAFWKRTNKIVKIISTRKVLGLFEVLFDDLMVSQTWSDVGAQPRVYNEAQCAVCIVQCAVCSVPCALYSV